MANIITNTEALDNTDSWAPSDVTITANTHPAPAFAGASAGLADTVADGTTLAQGVLVGVFYSIPADTADYLGSVFIRKDAVTDRWPELTINTNSGVNGYVNLNTSTGAIADGSTPPAASGIEDVDSNWWRLWMRIANNGTGDNIRMFIWPSHKDALGGSDTSAATGSVVAWGFNLTQSSVLLPYEPHPYYTFDRGSFRIPRLRPNAFAPGLAR